jgi:hypothetical protein
MWAYRFGDPHSRARGNKNGASAWISLGGNGNPISATAPAGVVILDNGKGAKNATIDAPALAGDDAFTPAMAPVGDVMPRNLSAVCASRAAFAHGKDKSNG